MSAPCKVSEEDIRRALKVWRGVVVDTARALAISENALRKRMKAMGIGPEHLSFLRSHNRPHQPQPTQPSTTQAAESGGHNHPPKSERHNYPRRVDARSFATMSTDVLARRAPQTKPPKLRPDQVDRVRDAKFDWQAKHRTETDEGALLQLFFDQFWERFLRESLTAGPETVAQQIADQDANAPRPGRRGPRAAK